MVAPIARVADSEEPARGGDGGGRDERQRRGALDNAEAADEGEVARPRKRKPRDNGGPGFRLQRGEVIFEQRER